MPIAIPLLLTLSICASYFVLGAFAYNQLSSQMEKSYGYELENTEQFSLLGKIILVGLGIAIALLFAIWIAYFHFT